MSCNHPDDYRCFDCATDEELAASIPSPGDWGNPDQLSLVTPADYPKHLPGFSAEQGSEHTGSDRG